MATENIVILDLGLHVIYDIYILVCTLRLISSDICISVDQLVLVCPVRYHVWIHVYIYTGRVLVINMNADWITILTFTYLCSCTYTYITFGLTTGTILGSEITLQFR